MEALLLAQVVLLMLAGVGVGPVLLEVMRLHRQPLEVLEVLELHQLLQEHR